MSAANVHADGAEVLGRLSHPAHRGQVGLLAVLEIPAHARAHRLGRGEIAGAQEHEKTLVPLQQDMHLAERAQLVRSRIGAGIRREDQPLLYGDGDTVRHGSGSLLWIRSAF